MHLLRHSMNKKLQILTCALLAIAAIAYFAVPFRSDHSDRDPLPAHVDREPEHDASMSAPTEEQTAPQTLAAQNAAPPAAFCDRRPECKDDPFIPVSQEELVWMRTHGYPTQEESERLARLSEVELEAEAKRGVLTAMTELGKRMIARGDRNGLSWYLKAKDHGSIYAYYLRSEVEMDRSTGRGFVEAGAFLRVAYILGDHKAGAVLLRFFEKNRLGMFEMEAIDRRAGELYQTYAQNRQPTPRPR